MRPDQWLTLEALCQAALERAPAERAAYLTAACGGDDALRREAVALLAQIDADPTFLERPLVTAAALGLAAPDDQAAGALGPYRVVRPLGRGGMGEVFLAIREGEGFQQAVAVKVVHLGMDTADVLRRFATERAILATLHHPNIAHFIDAGSTDNGRPYFVMEYVDGRRIDRYCAERRLALRERLALVQTICDAVQHAHRNLVVHRDLKPGNILVTPDGTPKLLDFGIGKLLGEAGGGAATTRSDLRALTPEYASPEQIRGEPVTTATDVHGLGILLYELLTGRHPFGAGEQTRDAVERAICDVEPLRPSRAVTERRERRLLGGDLDTIVLKALRKDPARRYASPAALAEDLQRYRDGRPVLARPDTATYRFGKFVRRNPWAAAAGGIAVLALGAVALISALQSRRLARERDAALEVRTFLLESFGARRADQPGDVPVTARQLLDGQATTLDFAYADQPDLQSQMHQVVAEAYERLGLYAEAEQQARRALGLLEQGGRATSAAASWTRAILGWIRFQQSAPREADSLLRQAVAEFRGAGGTGRRGLARALNDLGVVRQAANDLPGAENALREALDLRSRYFPREARAIGTTASNLAALRYRRGFYGEAVDIGERALQALRRSVGPDHQRSIIAQINLAGYQVALGNNAAAEREYRDLLDRQTRLQGRAHPLTVRIMVSLASVLQFERQPAAAAPLLREALGVQQQSLGPAHRQVAVTLRLLGPVLAALGDFNEATAVVTRALAIQRQTLGAVNPDVGESLAALADINERRGDLAAAERLHEQAMAVFDSTSGAKHPRAIIQRVRLARLRLLQTRPVDALTLLEDEQALLGSDSSGAGDGLLRSVRLEMARARLALGQRGAAESVLAVAERGMPAVGQDPQRAVIADLHRELATHH